MNAGLVALLVFAVTFAAAMAGLRLRDRLPEHHLDGESRDAVKLVMGLVATMSALVLSLLISVTQTAYRTQSDEIALLAANLVALDRVLLHYGRDAEPVRDLLRQGVGQELVKIMSPGGVTTKRLMPQGQENPLDPFHAALWNCSQAPMPSAWASAARSSSRSPSPGPACWWWNSRSAPCQRPSSPC